jgi:hypothetical protein
MIWAWHLTSPTPFLTSLKLPPGDLTSELYTDAVIRHRQRRS